MSTLDKRTFSVGFKPAIGQVILATHRIVSPTPERYEILGYSIDDRGNEIVEYKLERLKNPSTQHLAEMQFYPNAPLDVKYCYSLMAEVEPYLDEEQVVGFLFSPEEALDLADLLEKEKGYIVTILLIRT